jgi:hypothetical protein
MSVMELRIGGKTGGMKLGELRIAHFIAFYFGHTALNGTR